MTSNHPPANGAHRSAPAVAFGALLAPLPHGATGSWDEIVLFGVAFALFGGYVLWMRGAFGREKDSKDDKAHDTGKDGDG